MDDDGFYILKNKDFYDPEGYYFNEEGFDELGGYYNQKGEYISPPGLIEIDGNLVFI